MKFPCNHCGQKLGYEKEQSGCIIECPACKKMVFLPKLKRDYWMYSAIGLVILLITFICITWRYPIRDYRNVNATNYLTPTNITEYSKIEIIPKEQMVYLTNVIDVEVGSPKYLQLKAKTDEYFNEILQLKANNVEIGRKYAEVLRQYNDVNSKLQAIYESA